MLKVATFNVNSIRARMPVLTRWLIEAAPDVVAIQETKVEDAKFPMSELVELGYAVSFHGQQRYNGVAILSRHPMEDIHFGFEDEDWPQDCRLMRAKIGDITLINTYVPNGTEVGTDKFDYKLRWFERFGRYVSEVAESAGPLLWVGDINVAPTNLDVYDPPKFEGGVGFHPDEHAALHELKAWGWTDCFRMFNGEAGQYTFWDYVLPNGFKRNLGWRIDHIYATADLVAQCQSCVVDKEPRSWEKPSDHTPVVATFHLG